MAGIAELIQVKEGGKISFGNHELEKKAKLEDFPFAGDILKVKTCKEITKLEKNGAFAYESVPGTTVTDFEEREDGVSFIVEGAEDAQITIGLMEDTEYEVLIDGESIGVMKTGLSGKISLGVELAAAENVSVRIEKR